MKKVLLSMLALCMSVSMFGATIYLNTTTVDYGADNAFLAIWTWGGNSADAWSIFSPVTGEEKLFSAEIADDRTGGKIIRFANSVTEPSWSAQQWNATGNLTIPNDANMITLTQWNDETPGSWSTYTPAASTDPSEIVYSIKHGWKDGQDASWSYKDLTPNGDGTYSIRDIYGGTGCNWKSTISSEKWISEPILVGSPAKGDSAVFTLDPTAETITITKIVSTDPTVALTVTGNAELGSAVTLSATVSNIEGDVTYNYYVKVDEGEFTALASINYTFADFGTYTFKVEAVVAGEVKAESTKAVAVNADWYVKGSFNSWKAQPKYGMKKDAEGVYTVSFELEAGTYEFKLNGTSWLGADAVNADCSDQGWEGNDNIKFTLGTAATVTVTYDGTNICLTSTLGKFGQVVITSYTIVGDAAIVGADWNTTNTAADMTDNGDGTWTWEKKDCDLEVKDYTYKVVGNHDYAVYQYPASDANKILPITETGTYDIVYTFKPGETPELTAVATKHSSPVTGLQESVVPVIYTRDGRIYGADDMRIYTVLGLDVTNMNGQLNGIYVVKTQAGIVKVVVR